MRQSSRVHVSALVLLFLCLPLCPADGDTPGWAEVQKQHRRAFKPLPLLSHAKAVKQVEPRLPNGIVIESGPFDRLIGNLLGRDKAQLALREEVFAALAQHPSPKAGKAIQGAFKTLAKEDGALLKGIAATEASYAEVYNRGWMDLGQSGRRTRQLAAVLIPYYRNVLARNAALRDGAAVALGAMKAGDALRWLLGAARRERDPALRAACAKGLGRVGGTLALEALEEAAAKDGEAHVRCAALASLTAWPVREMKAAIRGRLSDSAWDVRALAVAMCVRANLVEAVPDLIAALANESGRLRKDIDDALFALVGARMYADVALWRKWLGENRAALEKKASALAASGAYDAPLGPIEEWPETDSQSDVDEERRGGTTAFYGIPTYSKRIVYVVDISRSMQNDAGAKPPRQGGAKDKYTEPTGSSKMAIARWQLHRAVHDLPDEAWFNIVVYSESYARWQPEMTQAKSRAKAKAHAFIDGLRANGTTNICDSLDEALTLAGAAFLDVKDEYGELAADTLYLLSDGDPNRGRITQLSDLLQEFLRRNARSRLVVHTVGIGEAAGSSFLRDIARGTDGRYVGFR